MKKEEVTSGAFSWRQDLLNERNYSTYEHAVMAGDPGVLQRDVSVERNSRPHWLSVHAEGLVLLQERANGREPYWRFGC